MQETKKSFEQRVIESSIRIIELKYGYYKPSQIRALLRDPRFEVTERGAVKIKGEVCEEDQLSFFKKECHAKV
jgi:hypothetical protein